MPMTTMGGKYPLQTLTAVGTKTITINSATPFVVNDFSSIQRIAALYNPQSLGSETITNGSFSADTNWTKGSGVTISSGVANCVNATSILSQNVSLTTGQLYYATFKYTRTGGANLRFSNSTVDGTNIICLLPTINTASQITLEFSFVAVSNGIAIAADGAIFSGTIDDFSIKPITTAATLKGISYVRGATSTTQLILESEFFDPVDGTIKTQAIGDQILISKSWSELVVTGMSYSSNTLSITDNATIGVATNEASACVYDEYKTLTSGLASGTVAQLGVAGGVWCQGHLENWTNQTIYGGCDYVATNSGGSVGILVKGLAAHYLVFGGKRTTTTNQLLWEPAFNVNTSDRSKTLLWMNVDTNNGILAPNGGASAWFPGTETRVKFFNCQAIGLGSQAIPWRQSNGNVLGGGCKVINSTGIAVFGTGYDGFAIGAEPGKRFIVSDARGSAALWDQLSTNQNATATFTNLWTPVENVARAATGSTVSFNFDWKSTYQNLQIGSLIQLLKSDNTTTDVAITTTTANTDITVRSHTRSGTNLATLPITYSNYSWTYAIWKYGYLPLSGSFALTTFSLGGGTANDVSHGGIFVQNLDIDITQTNSATVSAYTTFSTLNQVYDYSMYWKASNSTNMKWQGISNRNLVPTGINLVYQNTIIIDSASASIYSPNTSTNVLTIKASTLDKTNKFTTLQASAITINANTTVNIDLTGSITNNGTIGGFIYGNITNTGTLANGIQVVGDLNQTTPTNIIGADIMGNINYNTNSNITITYTNSTITGTISNAGSGIITIQLINSTIGTAGLNVVGQYPITISDSNNNAISVRAFIYDNTSTLVSDTGYQSLVNNYTVYMPIGGSIRVYSVAYGYIAKITNTNSTSANLIITHIPETLVDTSLNTATRNLIASYFNAVIESSIVYVELSQDLAQYTPDVVLNAMHYFIVSNGANLAYQALSLNSVNAITLVNGGFRVNIANFKGRPAASLNSTNTPKLYITIPLIFEDNTGISGNQILVRNANSIAINPALWTKAQANITAGDVSNITNNVWTYSDRTLNGALFK